MQYARSTETKEGTVFIFREVSEGFFKCEKEVDKISGSIKKLIYSTRGVLENVIPTDVTNQMQEQYKHCLRETINIALDDTDKLIKKYAITRDYEIEMLKEPILDLLDDVEDILHQD
ncbi:MAG: hypothetical protein MRZ93_08210 [Lachnospiraceae bacterium]|nr:hypothetical protein [Lachnospiraceae bacterium]